MSSGTNIERLNQNNELLTNNNSELENLKTLVESLPIAIDTSDATATSSDIVSGKTAYVKGKKIEGNVLERSSTTGGQYIIADTMTESSYGNKDYVVSFGQDMNIQQDTLVRAGSAWDIWVDQSAIANAINLTADKIVEGNTILGVTGTAKLGTATYESLEALQAVTGSEGDIAIVIDSNNTYIGTYKFNTANTTWEEIVSTTAYDSTLTNDEYDEALTLSDNILG